MTSISDEEYLLQQIGNGSSKAFEQFYDRYSPLVFRIALGILKNQADAEDLCHDVFLEIYHHAASYNRDKGSIEAWIAVRTRSRCLDRLRRARHIHSRAEEELNNKPAEQPPVEEQIILKDEREAIHKALNGLPAAQRLAIYGNFFLGYSHRKLAAQLNRPLGTIKSLVRYGMNNMRKYLKEQTKDYQSKR